MIAPLISPGELTEVLSGGAPVRILDVRYRLGGPPGAAEFALGHIPGAAYVDLDAELAGAPGAPGRHPLPDPAAFAAAMRRHGVSRTDPVVVYDDWGSVAAARAWWLLVHHGHPDVRVLDGGLAAWVESGGELSTTAVGHPVGDFVALEPGRLDVLDAAAAAALARRGLLLDARAAERYRGEVEPIDPVAGHIPGAISAPSADCSDEEGRLLPAPLLVERFAALGAVPSVQVGVYCGSGVTAAHTILALTVAGVPAALYAGSWSNWVADRSRPVAVGADPG